MNKQDYQSTERHLTFLGWLHIASNLLLLLIAGFTFFMLVSVGLFSGDPEAAHVLPVIGTVIGGFMTILALPGILTGIGLLKRKPWSRIAAVILGALGLMNVPFGTAVGVYTLWILLQNEAADHFVTAKFA